MYKKIRKWIALALAAYLIYFGIIIFSFEKEVGMEYKLSHPVSRFYSGSIGADRALIIDEPRDAALVRTDLIEQAQKTLDISYYSVEAGYSTDLFWSLLLEAADRGVQIRIVLDGVANGVMMKQKDTLYALKRHRNIDLKLYELPNLAFPWTLNNRLHDKYIIADQKIAVLGGRNISDRFLAPVDYKGEIAYDRDVVIDYKGKANGPSVIQELGAYFNQVYQSPYAKAAIKQITEKGELLGQKKELELQRLLRKARDESARTGYSFDWKAKLIETNKITLIHNPVTRFNKEPWVWFEIKRLMHTAEDEVFWQSPYIVSAKKMSWAFLAALNKKADVHILTNSRGSTPNYPAFSAYLLQRDKMAASGIRLYEYQGEHSVHTKTYLVDDDISIIGSFNMDPRSAFLSTETMLVIHGKQLQKQVVALNEKYIDKSLQVGSDGEYIIEEGSVEERVSGRWKNIVLKLCGSLSSLFSFLL